MYKYKFLLLTLTLCFSFQAHALLTLPSVNKPTVGQKDVPVSIWASWTSNQSSFEFELDTTLQFNSFRLVKGTAGSSKQGRLSNMDFGKRYYFRLRAKTSTDSSLWTLAREFTTLGAPEIWEPKDQDSNLFMIIKLKTFASGSKIRVQMDTSQEFNSPHLYSKIHNNHYNLSTFPEIIEVGDYKRMLFDTKYYIRMKYYHDFDSTDFTQITFRTMKNVAINYPKGNIAVLSPSLSLANYMIAKTSTPKYSDSLFYQYQIDTNAQFNSPYLKNYYTLDHVYPGSNIWLFYKQQFYIRARGLHIRDTSEWSKVEAFKTMSTIYISSPTFYDSLIRADSQRFVCAYDAQDIEFELDTSKLFNSPKLVKMNMQQGVAKIIKGLLYNRKYYNRTRGINSGGDTSQWGYRNFYTTFIPNLSSPANNSTFTLTAVRLKWDKMAGSGIEYLVDTLPNFKSPALRKLYFLGPGDGDSLKYMYFNQTHYWKIRHFIGSDTGSWSQTFKLKTSDMALPIVSPNNNEKNVAVNPTPINWNDMYYNYIKGYHYQLSKDSFFANPINGYTDVTKGYADHMGLEYSTKYFLRVRAFHERDTNDFYYEHRFFTKAPDPAPAIPVKISPADGSVRQNYLTLPLSWQAAANATSYDVETDVYATFTNPVKGNFTATSINLTNLNPFTQYYWRVRGVNGSTKGTWSSVWSFTTLPPVVPPTNLVPDNFLEKPKEFSLNWNTVFGASYYQYQLSNSMSFGSQLFTANGNSAYLTGLTNGLTYYWRVRSIFDNYASGWSAIAIFRVNGNLTGLEGIILKDELSVFPNPGNGKFYLGGSAAGKINSIEVYDMMGKKIRIAEVETGTDTLQYIELSDLPAGIYVLQTLVDGKLLSFRVSIL